MMQSHRFFASEDWPSLFFKKSLAIEEFAPRKSLSHPFDMPFL